MYTQHYFTFEDDCNVLIRAWGIADRLMMSTCKNNIMDCMLTHFGDHRADDTHLEQVESLGFTSSQAVVRFLKDKYIYQGIYYSDGMQDSIEDLLKRNTALAKDIVKGFVSKVNRRLRYLENKAGERNWNTESMEEDELDPADGSSRIYHEHDERERCFGGI